MFSLLAAMGSSHDPGVLSDPIFWAILAVVVAIVVPVVLYVLGRTRKALAYETSATPLVRPAVHAAFEIFFQGTRVHDVHLIEIDIGNIGNAPIRTEDYEQPLTLGFGATATVLSAQVAARRPADLDPVLDVTDNAVVVRPLLLNRGDAITLHVLATGFRGNVRLSGRIVGIATFRTSLASAQDLALEALVEMSTSSLGGVVPLGRTISHGVEVVRTLARRSR